MSYQQLLQNPLPLEYKVLQPYFTEVSVPYIKVSCLIGANTGLACISCTSQQRYINKFESLKLIDVLKVYNS